METPRYSGLVPMLPVTNVTRTIEFYQSIGFTLGNTVIGVGETEPNWAWLYNNGAHVMINKAPAPVQVTHESIAGSCWVYTHDVEATYQWLKEKGVEVSEISYPFYNPRGEFHVHDPDGYAIFIAHTD